MRIKPLQGTVGSMLTVFNPPQALRDGLVACTTFPNPAYQAAKRYSPWGVGRIAPLVYLSEEVDQRLSVPRGFDVSALNKLQRFHWNRVDWSDYRTQCETNFPVPRIPANKEQQVLLTNFKRVAFSKKECPFGNILYVAPTGVGKTIFQALAASVTRQRTLVLCLTELIKRAWYNDLERLFGIVERDVGLIQQKTWRLGQHFTLASVMTLIKRKAQWPELFNNIGCVIVDEADTITAPSIHRFLMACPTKFIIGATATDYVEGSRGFYLPMLFGPVRKRIVAQQHDTATSLALKEVQTIQTDFEFDTDPDQPINWHELSECMMVDEDRNTLIVQNAIKDWNNGESVLIVTRRVAHVHLLIDMLRQNKVMDANPLTGETNVNRIYTEKLMDLVLRRKIRMLVATIQAIKRGANLNPLSSLHGAMPVANKRDLEQLIGRIRRRATDKTWCKYVYYLDSRVPYLDRLYFRKAIPVFRKLKVKGFEQFYTT